MLKLTYGLNLKYSEDIFMEKARFKAPSAVFGILTDPNSGQILLQKRKKTGYKDGFYDLGAAGHVENNEPMTKAMQRELFEELGIKADLADIKFVTMIHKNDVETGKIYYNAYFLIQKYHGTPKIMEPDKNSELTWASLDKLPSQLINDRKLGVYNYLQQIPYSEFGWDK